MDARDLGPSLYASSNLVEAASAQLLGLASGVTLQVRADFRRGSFEVALIAAAIGHQLLQNISISDLGLVLKSIGFLGRSPKSLLRLLLTYGDRQVERIEPVGPGVVNLHLHGGQNTIIVNQVPADVARLITNDTVRSAIPEIVAPVAKPGINSLRLGAKSKPTLRIAKKDLPKLKAPGELKAPLTDSVAVTALELLSPNFVDGNKWRVAQGGEPFWVRMLDEDYLGAIDRGELSFMKGDFLVVELRTRAFTTTDGLSVERDVLRVIDHKHRSKQLSLG